MGEKNIKTFRPKDSELSFGHDELKILVTCLNVPDYEEGISTWNLRRRNNQE